MGRTGEHSELIRSSVKDFGPHFRLEVCWSMSGTAATSRVTSSWGFDVDSHGKMPDVVRHFVEKNWLLLVESVTSHGLVDGKHYAQLAKLLAKSTAGLVFVTAFPDLSLMSRYLGEITWVAEVWVVDAPSHMIHFNVVRFFGPYKAS